MDLRSECAFWPIRDGLLNAYPRLSADLKCEVLVVGAGITGATIAYELTRLGRDVVVVDGRDVGMGSTAASTALLQYELDQPLLDLAEQRGADAAVRAYRVCLDYLGVLEDLLERIGASTYAQVPSVYLATKESQLPFLAREAAERRRHRIPSSTLDSRELRRRYGLVAPGALHTSRGAQVDPYEVTHRLLHAASRAGCRVFDRTRVRGHDGGRGGLVTRTRSGHAIRSRFVVLATGYEFPVSRLRSSVRRVDSYAWVSEPIPTVARPRPMLVWTADRPYLYMRTTVDGRLMAGGGDEPHTDPETRDARVKRKALVLRRQVERVLPDVPLQVAYAWTGTFVESPDSLPFVGTLDASRRLLAALCYGANGILFGGIAADLVAHAVRGRRHPDADLFAIDRRVAPVA